jgi:hypothetical protein
MYKELMQVHILKTAMAEGLNRKDTYTHLYTIKELNLIPSKDMTFDFLYALFDVDRIIYNVNKGDIAIIFKEIIPSDDERYQKLIKDMKKDDWSIVPYK